MSDVVADGFGGHDLHECPETNDFVGTEGALAGDVCQRVQVDPLDEGVGLEDGAHEGGGAADVVVVPVQEECLDVLCDLVVGLVLEVVVVDLAAPQEEVEGEDLGQVFSGYFSAVVLAEFAQVDLAGFSQPQQFQQFDYLVEVFGAFIIKSPDRVDDFVLGVGAQDGLAVALRYFFDDVALDCFLAVTGVLVEDVVGYASFAFDFAFLFLFFLCHFVVYLFDELAF